MNQINIANFAAMANQFQTAMGQNPNDLELHERLIREELEEFTEAWMLWDNNAGHEEAYNLLKESTDFLYVLSGAKDVFVELDVELMGTVMQALQSVQDSLSYILQDYIILQAFHRVHASNMSKLDDEGKPVKNEHGKVMKGPNYQKPYLDDLVSAMITLSLKEE